MKGPEEVSRKLLEAQLVAVGWFMQGRQAQNGEAPRGLLCSPARPRLLVDRRD